ncbi:MAG: SOS response-associated peptidase family protein [Pseudomonadota bacterium]
MCYYTSRRHPRDEVAAFANQLDLPFENALPELPPRYRFGPKQDVIVFRLRKERSAVVELAEFGLIPLGAKVRPKRLLANARSDGLAAKWPWKFVIRTRRAVGVIDGFFDPEKVAMSKEKAPWSYYEVRSGELFFVAGFATEFVDAETGEVVTSCAFVTVDANSAMRVHNRMPAILDVLDAKAWLSESEPPLDVLKPFPPDLMDAWRVSDAAKNPRTPDGPELIQRVDNDQFL